MTFISSILTFTLITCITVCGLYILTGLTGMFSLGQAAFMAIGAYTGGLLAVRLNVPFPICLIAAIAMAILIGFCIGFPIMRLRRDYLALVTLGFGEAIIAIINQSVGITGGSMGLTGIPKHTTTWLVVVFTILAIIFARNFRRSKFGRQAIAVRSDELAAQSMGINVPRVKMRSFLIAASLTSLSGCLYAFFIQYADPTLFNWRKSGEWVIMVFFGGVNSLTGSIFATFLLTSLPEILRSVQQYRLLVYSALVLLAINFKPDGLFGNWELTDLFVKKKKAAAGKETDK
ncbi:MAG: branched-chain amino acid ABC transporter permease [Oscillospiraceae bacterium]|nr:branched-chain amino acid ABC transporter permease [Oscillospiraceae bacterium]